jgi:hypothetical protein
MSSSGQAVESETIVCNILAAGAAHYDISPDHFVLDPPATVTLVNDPTCPGGTPGVAIRFCLAGDAIFGYVPDAVAVYLHPALRRGELVLVTAVLAGSIRRPRVMVTLTIPAEALDAPVVRSLRAIGNSQFTMSRPSKRMRTVAPPAGPAPAPIDENSDDDDSDDDQSDYAAAKKHARKVDEMVELAEQCIEKDDTLFTDCELDEMDAWVEEGGEDDSRKIDSDEEDDCK